MAFADLLNRPLPSRTKKEQNILESVDDLVTESELDDILGVDGEDQPINNDDTDNDDEIGAVQDIADDVVKDDDDDKEDSDGNEEVSLTDDEADEARRTMDLVATPVVIKNVLSDDEAREFAESADFDVAVSEGFITEAGELGLTGEFDVFTEAKFAPKTKVKFSLKDRLSQLFEVSVLCCARAHKDPKYFKLVKIQKARRILKKDLRNMYKAEAMRQAKGYLARLKKSKSNVLNTIGKKFVKH